MARRRLHTLDELLDIAEQIVTSGDPAGLTLRALASATGASNGTIYHAFSSKDQLLAQLWLRAWSRLGDQIVEALHAVSRHPRDDDEGVAAVIAAALAPVEFVRRFPISARLFFAQRRDQLFSDDLPPDTEAELEAVQKRFVNLLIDLAQGVWGRSDRVAVDAIAVCVVDLPTGILRRKLVEEGEVDEAAEARLQAAVRAVLAVPLPSREATPRSDP
ncbi:TetR family transcriptional regulator [Aeromicrobium sp. PE09-221]|uniref:TetR/AcrR family transcriptional regulator n=1 Tax=Aeromicrobium sp. PE09-221 TaxID=1898043 RepID=UPI000B3E8E6F|nr:TetR/AcrR family transcriptional regulator [Aeromicrobium sp. PE09-221]OUZ09477.1 TetR family transcriptional regulator [Aeromicrobium sp. PE09-221]